MHASTPTRDDCQEEGKERRRKERRKKGRAGAVNAVI